MNKKIIIIFAIVCVGFVLLTSPAFAKENVNVKISTDKWLNGKGVILIKLVDDRGREIHTNGKINYTITDSNGHYEWKYKSYTKFLRIKYDAGWYNVQVKFDGDKKYSSAVSSQDVNVPTSRPSFDAYNYYDNHNWGLNQKMDDYIEDNYWDEEIYDDPSNYDGEGY